MPLPESQPAPRAPARGKPSTEGAPISDLDAACVLPSALPADTAATIAGFELFRDVEPAAIAWLIDRAEVYRYAADASISRAGDVVDDMILILSGRTNLSMETNKGYRDLGDARPGEMLGVLPFSRMTHALGNVRASEETLVLRLHRRHFVELVQVSYTLVQNLVASMSDRIREFSEQRAQDEKMMSLGKLSAGLAHELNNPAAAIVRSAEALTRQLHATPESFKAIMLMQVSPAEVDAVNAVIFERLRRMAGGDDRGPLARLEAAEAIEDWLGGHGLAAEDELVESLVAARFEPEHLDEIYRICAGRSIAGILAWTAKNVDLELLSSEIRDGAARISELVGSVKSYTHMDRASGPQALDVHEGLRTTLVMLKHKFKRHGVELARDFDTSLPLVEAYGGQINQVYTNLIDNAIDAARDGTTGSPRVTVRTRCVEGAVCVEIEDNGPGIPEAYREQIFSPFFTTKPLGEGTGMGLDIVRKILAKHGAAPEVESAPGRTVVRFCLGGGAAPASET